MTNDTSKLVVNYTGTATLSTKYSCNGKICTATTKIKVTGTVNDSTLAFVTANNATKESFHPGTGGDGKLTTFSPSALTISGKEARQSLVLRVTSGGITVHQQWIVIARSNSNTLSCTLTPPRESEEE